MSYPESVQPCRGLTSRIIIKNKVLLPFLFPLPRNMAIVKMFALHSNLKPRCKNCNEQVYSCRRESRLSAPWVPPWNLLNITALWYRLVQVYAERRKSLDGYTLIVVEFVIWDVLQCLTVAFVERAYHTYGSRIFRRRHIFRRKKNIRFG